jgi:hypothetical protein
MELLGTFRSFAVILYWIRSFTVWESDLVYFFIGAMTARLVLYHTVFINNLPVRIVPDPAIQI